MYPTMKSSSFLCRSAYSSARRCSLIDRLNSSLTWAVIEGARASRPTISGDSSQCSATASRTSASGDSANSATWSGVRPQSLVGHVMPAFRGFLADLQAGVIRQPGHRFRRQGLEFRDTRTDDRAAVLGQSFQQCRWDRLNVLADAVAPGRGSHPGILMGRETPSHAHRQPVVVAQVSRDIRVAQRQQGAGQVVGDVAAPIRDVLYRSRKGINRRTTSGGADGLRAKPRRIVRRMPAD
jgi:hypothetical protein